MLLKISLFLQWLYGERETFREPVCPTQHPYAKAMTPDQLIANQIIDSFAKEYDDWSFDGSFDEQCVGDAYYRKPVKLPNWIYLKNSKRNIIVAYAQTRRSQYGSYSGYPDYYSKIHNDKCYVNMVHIDEECAKEIRNAWVKLTKQLKEAKAAAEAAKKAMEENEKKWNLAERLSGLKRNEHGALVPANPVEHDSNPPKVETTIIDFDTAMRG